MKVDDPVHQIEGDEGDREKDPRVFVNVRRGDAHHFLQVLLALQLLLGRVGQGIAGWRHLRYIMWLNRLT